MDAVGLEDGELVHVWAVDHKSRLETYVFGGPNGTIGMNGGAAHFFEPGDRVIIASFAMTDETVTPQVVLLGDNNEIVRDMSPFTIHG